MKTPLSMLDEAGVCREKLKKNGEKKEKSRKEKKK
jgi:hypothetical protein